MRSFDETPDRALEAVAQTDPLAWTIARSSIPGILMAHLDVDLPETGERRSFSVSGWTREEIENRIESLRHTAASLLGRRREGRA